MCNQCGCIQDPVGTAMAWAETGRRSSEERIWVRLAEIERRLSALERLVLHAYDK